MNLDKARLIAAVAAVILLSGGAGAAGRSDGFSDVSRETEVRLFVTNLAFSDVTLYGITNGGRRRIGRLIGKKESVFTIPMRISSEFYIELDFLAGPTCQTEAMRVDPGDHLELIVQNESRSYRCRVP